MACDLGAVGLGGAGFATSITVSFSKAGRCSIEALANAVLGGSAAFSASKIVSIEVLALPG